jgi:hypothetical protein
MLKNKTIFIDPITDYYTGSKTPNINNYNRPNVSVTLMPNTTKTTSFKTSLISNVFMNRAKRSYCKETMPILIESKMNRISVRAKDLSTNSNDLSPENRAFRGGSKEDRDDYFKHYTLVPIRISPKKGEYNERRFSFTRLTTENKINEPINLSDLLSQHHKPLDINVLKDKQSGFENNKVSTKPSYCIKAYCANTNQGIYR